MGSNLTSGNINPSYHFNGVINDHWWAHAVEESTLLLKKLTEQLYARLFLIQIWLQPLKSNRREWSGTV